MLDALNRAARYRELAKGCRDLAAIAFSIETRTHFLSLAEHYRTQADAEERRISAYGDCELAETPSPQN
jgi:hypothetical protein